MDGHAAQPPAQLPFPHHAHLRLPHVGLLPARKSHQPDGPADNARHACAQFTPAEHPCQHHHDGLRAAVPDVHQRNNSPDRKADKPRRHPSDDRPAKPLAPFPLSCRRHTRHRHLRRSHLGKRLVGRILGMGSQGGLGANHVYGVCSRPASQDAARPKTSCDVPRVHALSVPHHPHDLLRCQLCPWRHA